MAGSWPVILFLDIDGVLNGHEFLLEAQSCKIDPACVRRLNRILKESDARIILTSAWRYMVHGHAMTLEGFGYMLRTHGFAASVNGSERVIIDLTCRDEDIELRADQVRAALASRPGDVRYAVIDDLDLGFTEAGLNFVQTDGRIGMTDDDADRVIAMLADPDDEELEAAIVTEISTTE